MTKPFILLGKLVATLSSRLNLGSGGTWPGHIALTLNPRFISEMLKNSPTQVIFIVGTNGKTTTSMILSNLLKENNKRVFQNISGANLLNGIASSLLLYANKYGQITHDYAVFEVDENFLALALNHITPSVIVALNLFRDQLDRYGELDNIAKKWNTSFRQLPESTILILNSDDPLVAYLAKDVKTKVMYFGLKETEATKKTVDYASDSLYCPNCSHKLYYQKSFYSHLGLWSCLNCGIKRPLPHLSESEYPLDGTYNQYNTLAAVLAAKSLGVTQKTIDEALKKITPAFGRQEKLTYKGHTIVILLSKNPTSMNESLKTISKLGARYVLFLLNDRIPDGCDVSWIWDIDMEKFIDKFKKIFISGDRCFDMGLRMYYSMKFPNNDQNSKLHIYENLKEAIDIAVDSTQEKETLFILPTYSAMLDVRKILTGRKIL